MQRKNQIGIQRRFVPEQRAASIRVDEGSGKSVLYGYAAVYYDGTPGTEFVLWDDRYGRAVERIMPGAFDAVLAEGQDVRGLFNHNADKVLGRTASGTMRLKTDAVGLAYEIDLGDDSTSRDVAEYVARKDVTGASFSFDLNPDGERWTMTGDEDGRINELREILSLSVLYDVGPVSFPAYEMTTAGARSSQEVSRLREERNSEREADEPKPELVDESASLGAEIENLQISIDAARIGI